MKTTSKKRITKSHVICFVISSSEDPMTRKDIMREVHRLEGKPSEDFAVTSNNCYWSPTGLGNGGRSSVIFRGLVEKAGVQKAGVRGREFTYRLTDAGKAHALEFIATKA